MTATRIQTEMTYRSTQSGVVWHFTVGLDQSGENFVKDIRSPFGTVSNSTSQVPGWVLDDINTATQELEDLVGTTSAFNTILNFSDQNTLPVVFTTPFTGADYGVSFTLPDFITAKITNQLTTGFTVVLGSNYTGGIRVDVFV